MKETPIWIVWGEREYECDTLIGVYANKRLADKDRERRHKAAGESFGFDNYRVDKGVLISQ